MSFAADRDPKVLMQAERAFAKATAERGVDGWMEFMAPNAVELSAEPLVGLDQIRAGMTKQFKLPGFKITWEPTKAEFLGQGDVGYAVGRYEVRFTGDDGKPQVRTRQLSHHLAEAEQTARGRSCRTSAAPIRRRTEAESRLLCSGCNP